MKHAVDYLQVRSSTSGGHVPTLPDLSRQPFLCVCGDISQQDQTVAAAAAEVAPAAAHAAPTLHAHVTSEADASDAENGAGVEHVLLEEKLVVKAMGGGDGGEASCMACEAQVMLMSDVMLWTPLHVKAASQQLQLKHVVSVLPMRSNPKAFSILVAAHPPLPAATSLPSAAPPPVDSGWAIGGFLKSYLTTGNKSSSSSSSITLEAGSADSCARWALAVKCLAAAVKRQLSLVEGGGGGGGGAAAHLFDESSISMKVYVPPASWQADVAAAPALHSCCPACTLALQQPPPPSGSSWLLPSLTQKAAVPTACPRFCCYTGRWFCSSCHAEETAVLPGYAATFFDLQPRPVCRSAAALLQAVEERAVLTLPPSLILQHPSLSLLFLYRVQFKHFRCFPLSPSHPPCVSLPVLQVLCPRLPPALQVPQPLLPALLHALAGRCVQYGGLEAGAERLLASLGARSRRRRGAARHGVHHLLRFWAFLRNLPFGRAAVRVPGARCCAVRPMQGLLPFCMPALRWRRLPPLRPQA